MYRVRTSDCHPLWVTLDPNVVIIQIFKNSLVKIQTIHIYSVYFRHLRITILGVEGDRVHWGIMEMTLDHWSFFKKFPNANRFPMKEFYFEYFLTGGRVGLNCNSHFFPHYVKHDFHDFWSKMPQHSLILV